MTELFPTLENAPIIEALIDIQVILEPVPSVEQLGSRIPEALSNSFPNREERKMFEGTFGEAKGKVHISALDHGTVGFILRDAINSKALQVRLDGFGFSHLQPYSDFPTFEEEAKNLWNQYSEFAGVSGVTRVALLYNNIIDCEKKVTSISELKKVLREVPDLPSDDESDVLSFVSQVNFKRKSSGLTAIVTKKTVQNAKTGATGIQIQIDCFKQFSSSPDEDELWRTVSELRAFKNEIFFNAVTEEQIGKFAPEE